MRILFSTDWHLGYEMGGANRVERLSDQTRQLKLIGRYLEEHSVDVLAVCGDVFEAQERARARSAVAAMMDALAPSLERGMQVVMIAGNHDRDYFMETASEWLEAGSAADRFVLATRPQLRTVEANGQHVNFALLPFPTPVRYAIPSMDDSGGAGARNERIVKHFVETMELLRQQAADQKLPTVLMTHVTVEGTEVGPHRLSPRDDVVVPRSTFPSFELSVVGHIHKAEKLSGAEFYYVGVLDRMDMGELYYEPRVLVADIDARGKVQTTSLPLDPTPFAEFTVETEEDLHKQYAFIPDPARTLVKLHIKAAYGTYTAPLIGAAKELFPRLYGDVQHEWVGAPQITPSVSGLDPADVGTTIHRYLEEQVQDETERAQLFELIEELQGSIGSPA